MKIRNIIIKVLLSGLILILLLPPCLAALEMKKEKEAQEEVPIIIPKEVKSVFEEGIETRQVRPDIPFTIIKHIYFPAGQNLHTVFLFKVKNEDLGFSPIAPVSESPEKKKEKEKTQPALQEASAKLQANSNIYLQLNRLENNVPGELIKELHVQVNLQEESSSYEPDKEELYSLAYRPLSAGDYILSMAIASKNLEKIGTQYFEFSLPDAASLTDRLETSPLFFVKDMKRIASPEMESEVHKGFFTYSILQIAPNVEGIFSPGENLEIFLFIFGVQERLFDLELVSWNWSPTEDGSYVEAKGQVKNTSNKSLQDVEAVVTFKDKEGKSIAQNSALIDFNPILAGQTSPFAVMEAFNPEINSASIQFKFLDGETIPTSEQQQRREYDIESNYEVWKEEELIIRFAPGIYDAPLISQSLPMKRTVIIKSESGEQRESRDLESGNYTLSMKITDKISGKSVNKSIDFEVK